MLKIYMDQINTLDLIGIGNWNSITPEKVEILGKQIESNDYINFIGNIINHGSLHNPSKSRIGKCLNFTINTNNSNFDSIKDNIVKVLSIYKAPKQTYKKVVNKNKVIYNAITYHAFLNEYFVKNLFKEIHKFNSADIDILLNMISKPKGNSSAFYTQSLELANNIQILALKAGYAPSLQQYKKKTKKHIEYYVSWSKTQDGKYPYVINKKNHVTKEEYNGTVWCLQVPSGIFVTRRNGKISIHGNSKYVQADTMINPTTLVKVGGAGPEYKPTAEVLEAYRQTFEAAESNKNFKIFTHDGVTIERIGFGQGIYDISGDITQLLKEIYIGLMVPPVLMDGGADTTYANGGVALDVLKGRYSTFRTLISNWLRTKIFAPISELNEFYEYVDGQKKLIVPEIDWNHMSLFDVDSYINILKELSQGSADQPKRASVHTLYKSLGLEWEDEILRIRKENIQEVIFKKEKEALDKMNLNDLRTINDDDEINEVELSNEENKEEDVEGGGLPGEDAAATGMPDLNAPPPLPGT